jgi:hypothetical protein
MIEASAKNILNIRPTIRKKPKENLVGACPKVKIRDVFSGLRDMSHPSHEMRQAKIRSTKCPNAEYINTYFNRSNRGLKPHKSFGCLH